MIIKSIDIFHASDGTRNNIFIEIATKDGIVGTGECYSIGPDKSVISFVEEIRSWFIGEDPTRIEWLLKRAKNNLRFPLGQVGWSALSGIDIALWDIIGKNSNQPIYSLLGGATRNKVRVYHAIYGDSPEELGNNALSLIEEGYKPPTYRDDLKLPGAGGRTAIAMVVKGFKAQGKISEHDEFIAKKLAYILTGGDKAGLTKSVDEQYLLDIEREAFVSLAGEKLSQDRIRYMLKVGKPLRN